MIQNIMKRIILMLMETKKIESAKSIIFQIDNQDHGNIEHYNEEFSIDEYDK
jgi:hypothetical protein